MTENSLYKVYEEAVQHIVDDPNNYINYLKAACNNYKCDFRELAMIYVAKPDATAVLTMEQWNSKFARVVKSTAKDIPVIDFSKDELHIKSYIDISDTESTEYSKPVPIWKLSELTHTNVTDTINKTFNLKTKDIKSAIIASVDVIIKDSFSSYIPSFLKVKNREQAFSAVSDMDAIRIYRDMIRSSTAFMVLSRCDLDTSDINMSSFENIKYFQSMDAFVELGNASFDNTKILLKNIATQALKEMRKEKSSYGKTEIGVQAGRTLYGGAGLHSKGRSDIEQIQQTQKDILVGTSPENVRQAFDVGQTESTSGRNRQASSRKSRGNNVSDEAGARRNGTAEEARPNEMGRDDEQHQEFSGRNSIGRDSLQLHGIRDTVQKENIENALVEDFNLSSTFSISQEDIDAVITKGSGFVNGKYRIYQYFEQDHSVKEQKQFLKKEYGIGGGTFHYPDGTNGGVDYNAKGIAIEKHGSYTNPDIVLSWSDVSKRIKQLIELDRYLTPKEKVLYSKWSEDLQEADNYPEEKETDLIENYVYKIGDKVNIGASEYIITFIDDTRVVLQDAEFPLFTKEYAFNDFDTKVQENPMNNHLKVVETTSNKLDTTEKVEANNKNFVERYRELEQEYPDKILLFQVGDFFEIMGNKAEKVSEALNITLTSRSNGDERVPMCGFPNSRLKTFTDMLLDRGYDLAIATDDKSEVVNFDSDRKHEPINSFPVGRIDYYNSNGEISDSIEYVNPTSIKRDLLNDSPFEEIGLVLYRDKDGNTIPYSFVDNLPKPLKNFEIVDYKNYDYEQKTLDENSDTKEKSVNINVPQSERNTFDLKSFTVEEVGKKARYNRNIEAIRILKECEFENRFATEVEQQKLALYVGWGGIPEAFDENNSSWSKEYKELYATLSPAEYAQARESTLTAFYTPPVVIKAMYKVLEQMNYREGNILEPSCGIGNFIGMLPETMKNSNFYGVELDAVSAGIAQQLYQKSNISAEPYEKVNLPDSFFDVVIGNVPFGDFKVADKRYDKHNFLIHDYFFAKSLDKLRTGGVMALITSKGTMDKENSSVRKYISQRAELLGAIRLPNNTFKGNAGTEVVSDILFLQKRDRLVEMDQEWLHLDINENGIKMNNYFIEHPEMVLGEMKMVSGRFGMESTCVPYSNANLEEQLMKAVENISGKVTEYDIEDIAEDNFIPADPSVRNFSYTIVEDNIYFRENSRMKQVDLSATADKRIRGMIKIRDSVRTLIELQTDNSPDEAIKIEQVKLNALYDEYTKEYGLLNSRANSNAFSDDSSYSLLCSLENIDENGKLESKADMFFKRTIRPHIPVTSVDNASDALALSISEKAKVDIQYMSEISHKPEQEIISDLKGVIFKVPSNDFVEYQTADEYLSGNVRQKLRIAETFEKENTEYSVNVQALRNVQPKDLKASEIDVRLGSTWLPIKVVEKFIYELLDTPIYLKYEIKVSFSAFSSEWNISGKSADKTNIKANKTYGTSRINAYRIIEDTLNLKDVKIFDTVEESDGKKKRILNKKETAIALSKQDQIKSAFISWVFKDPERRNELCKIYNERFNSIRPREYDGSHITFGGMSPEISLREHQLNAVAHVLYGGNTLLAHVVGAGKTYEMVASAMESKRLGLCTKSLFVVPNHLIEQWASEFLQLYPSANILSSTKKDFEPANRKRFCGRIATGDYDAVIIGQSQFEKIPMSIERQRLYLENQMDEILEGIAELKRNDGDNFTIKQMEKTRKSLKLKLDKLNDQSRKDDVVTFEELGVDRLFIDESHYYKNLYLYTKMRNVGGIAQTEAQKSSDLFMKCRYLDEITDNRGVIFATGTPISNSMVEMYTVQRYLQYDKLVDLQLQHFDAWASTFGETVTALELAPEGYTLIGR